MKVRKCKLYSKMLFSPRMNLECDGVKIKMAYVSNESGNGWMIENLNNDGKTEWFKGVMTNEIADMIFEKYKEVDIKWSRRVI
ncbi:hypothetical protein P5F12_13525 [Clostridium perfringens]|nr:hypothetical protein [Clostridium perfringens]